MAEWKLMNMSTINIKNEFLTGYYLEQRFQDELDKTGFEFIDADDDRDKKQEILLHYKDGKDLEEKISYILMVLTDK
jgi:hypothetical protein